MPEENEMPMGDEQNDVPEPPKKHKMLSFGGRSKEGPSVDISGIMNDVNSLSRRLRLVEEGSSNIRNMLQITEENVISKNRTLDTEVKTLTSDINDIRKEIHDMKDKIFMIMRELQTAAKKEDVKLLEKYVNLWNPVKFVTRG